MRRAATIDDFVGDPVGRFSLGATHIVWCHSPTLRTAHWGKPTETQAGELVRRLDLSIDTRAGLGLRRVHGHARHGVVRLVGVQRGVGLRADAARRVGAADLAATLIVPRGVVGVFVAGLMPLLEFDDLLRFFTSVAEAVEWLGRDEMMAVLDSVGPLVEEARGVAPLLRSLREYLERSLSNANVKEAAHSLGLSPRSLQREMREEGTHFTIELMNARVRAACTMLEHSDEKIESIARRVGCTSSSQLSGLFRRQVGETPARYRSRRRGGTGE